MTISSFTGLYDFLSNFYRSTIIFDGVIYATNEHAFQAAKTLIKSERTRIMNAETPGKAKRFGGEVKLREDWESVKVDIMRKLIEQKFSRGTDNARRLLMTKDEELIEGNKWNDTFWGVCDGVGENHLGKLLMEVRESLKKEE